MLNAPLSMRRRDLEVRVLEGLGPTAASVEGGIERAIADIEASIRESDRFIRTIE